jgi:membrane protease YdiL (CAAX protease family)
VRESVALHLIVFLAYNLAMSVAVVFLAPPIGLGIALFLFWLTLSFYVLREHPTAGMRKADALRLHPLSGGVLKWTLLAIPVMLVLVWSLGELYISIVPVPPEAFNPFGPLLRDPMGRLTVAVLAIGIAPVLEEVFFRGLIQRRMELRWGTGIGIVGTAILFALVHVQPWVLPLHLILGLIFGWVVYVTGSIWSGVLLHAANNTAAVVGLRVGDDPFTRPTIWEIGLDAGWWTTLGLLFLSIVAAVWVGRGLVGASVRS